MVAQNHSESKIHKRQGNKTPHHSTVTNDRHTHSPQQASMPSQSKPHRNRHKNQQHHRDRRHTCPDAPEQSRPLVLPSQLLLASLSLFVSVADTCSLLSFFKHHFLSNSSSTQQHVKATHRCTQTCKQTYESSPLPLTIVNALEAVEHITRVGVCKQNVWMEESVQAKIESS